MMRIATADKTGATRDTLFANIHILSEREKAE